MGGERRETKIARLAEKTRTVSPDYDHDYDYDTSVLKDLE